MKRCCGFGHRLVYTDISTQLVDVLWELIENENVREFYTGNMGEFDIAFSKAVRLIKRDAKDIKLVLVKPYFSRVKIQNKGCNLIFVRLQPFAVHLCRAIVLLFRSVR